MRLDRVAVITGSAQGLGKGIAEKLGTQGYKKVYYLAFKPLQNN